MNIAVCVKQIPDPAVPGKLDADHTLDRSGEPDPRRLRRYGVEMALQLADKAGGGDVDPGLDGPQRRGLGPAHRARHGRGPGGARLRRRARRLRLAVDGEGARQGGRARRRRRPACSPRPSRPTATRARSPAQVAELLGWPSLTFAKHVEVGDGKVTIQRQTEAGYDVVEASLPAVVSVTAGVVEPRYPSFKGIMAAKNKPVDAGDRRRPRPRRRPGRLGRRAPADRVGRRRARARGRREDRGRRRGVRAHRRSSSSSSRSSERFRREEEDRTVAISKIWVFAEADGDKPATSTLELLTKARELGDTRRGGVRGCERRRARGRPRRARRDEGVRGRPRRRAARAWSARPRWRRSIGGALTRRGAVRAELRRPRRGRAPLGEARPSGAHQRHRRCGSTATSSSSAPRSSAATRSSTPSSRARGRSSPRSGRSRSRRSRAVAARRRS